VNAGVRYLCRFDRRKLMLLSDVARMFTVLLFIFVRSSDSLWLLYVASILQFSVRAWRSLYLYLAITTAKHLIRSNSLDSWRVVWSRVRSSSFSSHTESPAIKEVAYYCWYVAQHKIQRQRFGSERMIARR